MANPCNGQLQPGDDRQVLGSLNYLGLDTGRRKQEVGDNTAGLVMLKPDGVQPACLLLFNDCQDGVSDVGELANQCLGILVIGLARASRNVVVPLWADHIGMTASEVSVLFGLGMGIEMLLFYPAGWIMDRPHRHGHPKQSERDL